jgi:hypothetical protein
MLVLFNIKFAVTQNIDILKQLHYKRFLKAFTLLTKLSTCAYNCKEKLTLVCRLKKINSYLILNIYLTVFHLHILKEP